MKQLTTIIALLILGVSCKKNDTLPRVETITKGQKWGIQIGATAADVYARLQALDTEKRIGSIDLIGQPTFTSPNEIGERMTLYNGVLFGKGATAHVAYTEWISIGFHENKVWTITESNTMLEQWPDTENENFVIRQNESANDVYQKLSSIYDSGLLDGYVTYLQAKALAQPFDPVMAGVSDWLFYIFEDIRPGISGRSKVTLHFRGGKLDKITHEYDEFQVYE